MVHLVNACLLPAHALQRCKGRAVPLFWGQRILPIKVQKCPLSVGEPTVPIQQA